MEIISHIKNTIEIYETFLLTTHINADGDGIGSMLGFGRSLKKLGKKVFYLTPDTVPPKQFSFLTGFEEINSKEVFEQINKNIEVLFVLDAPNLERIEGLDLKKLSFKEVVRIDHHKGIEPTATINYVKEGYPSTSCLIWEIIKSSALPVDEEIANALYLGILTDTGSFRFNNTNEIAFQVAKELVVYGAKPYKIARYVYEMESLTHLKLLGVALLRLEIIGKLGFSYLTRADFEKFNAQENDTEGIVDYLRKEKDIEVILFLRELKEGGYKGSLRSKNSIDVRRVAEIFGGGGHKEAAGFKSTKSKEEILKIVVKEIENEA